ncbi:valine--tRNA ligase [cf. Phormidesmis sp. LEGE 11477]|uniref:valine--tRNA ligase n=1 Tax=cf. Phormidesmis sp. LEGE 11477 TaxID=1828680 RepID=UPI001880573F|nr:valine--tRNA ligase [cf. Phormidesmis sp. LEGE 11477]
MTATTPALASQYDPTTTETKWQDYWQQKEVFKADPSKGGEPFCVMIPPPNVTGSLHIGHAFEQALIDTVVRYQRMKGKNTLYLPGTDHASIAVQTILEQQFADEGQTRESVGRERFLERAWEWKRESGGTIVGQLLKLGISADWSRERFTMDEGLSTAVLTAFNQLYEEGLIYRGSYMVNWCPASQSAVSDLEVENKEVDGKLWHFRYPLVGEEGELEVATTRPETMLGDTAVAVNPNDERYRHLIGKKLWLPIADREIPIIGDEFVDSEFGTGCVKVTPAHDPNDFKMGKRHDLPVINILNKDGTLNENAGTDFVGVDRFVARDMVIEKLTAEGRMGEIEDYRHSVPYSDRGKVPVEPLISTQWFVKIEPLAQQALTALDQKSDPQFVPERWTKVYRDWLVNLNDWCISRQLWWGHQIPAWYVVTATDGEICDDTPFVVAKNEGEAWEKAKAKYGDDIQLKQDPDVLDTWFSSGLWPMSTLGWPNTDAPDYQFYYPTQTLVTGFDIIFFWVARMTLMAGHFTGKMPFETVYIHGLVRDENNQKMSKSKGNGIDPLVLIGKYGTDALRYTLVREVAGAGQDIRLDYDRQTDESSAVEASRNFTNKLWNASRFVMMNLDGQSPSALGMPGSAGPLELTDQWIISKFHQAAGRSRTHLDKYGMGEAAKDLYEFTRGDFCDWYIELVKPRLYGEGETKRTAQQTLAYVLEGILKLLHPFMPHITEELWHTLTGVGEEDCLALQRYPEPESEKINSELEQQFELLFDVIRTIRNLRAEAGVKPSAKIEAILKTDSPDELAVLESTQAYIQAMARVETLAIQNTDLAPESEIVAETLTVSRAAEIVETAAPGTVNSTLERLSKTYRDPSDVSAWEKALDAVLQFLDEPVKYFQLFFSDYKKPALSLAIILGTVITYRVLDSMLDSIDEVPGLRGLFQLVGLFYVGRLGVRRLFKAEARDRTFAELKEIWSRIAGDRTSAEPEPAAQSISQPAEPYIEEESAAQEETTAVETIEVTPAPEGVSPADLVRATSQPMPESGDQRKMFAGVTGTVQVLIPLTGVVDVDALRAKLEKDLAKAEGEMKSLNGRLGNQGFVNQAPAEVVQGARDALAEAEKQATLVRERLAML